MTTPGPDALMSTLVAALDDDDHARAASTARELAAYCDRYGVLARYLPVGALLVALACYAGERHERAPRALLDALVRYACEAFDRVQADPRPRLSPAAEREAFRVAAVERLAQVVQAHTLDAVDGRGEPLPFEPDDDDERAAWRRYRALRSRVYVQPGRVDVPTFVAATRALAATWNRTANEARCAKDARGLVDGRNDNVPALLDALRWLAHLWQRDGYEVACAGELLDLVNVAEGNTRAALPSCCNSSTGCPVCLGPDEADDVPHAARIGEPLHPAFRLPRHVVGDPVEPDPEQDRDPIYCVTCASVAVGLDALGRPSCARCARGA